MMRTAPTSGRILAILLASAAFIQGCESQPWGNLEPPQAKRADLARAMAAIAKDHTPQIRVSPAGARGRWADVELALVWAIADDGVEMGIVRTEEFDWGYQFSLKTVEGWPATLTVRRSDEVDASGQPRIYEAAATVGRFPDMPARRDRAQKLLDAFDRWMTALGKKAKPVSQEQ